MLFRRVFGGLKDFEQVFAIDNMVRYRSNADGKMEKYDPELLIGTYKQHAAVVDNNNKQAMAMVSRRSRIATEVRQLNVLRSKYSDQGYTVNIIDTSGVDDDSLNDDEWYDVMMTRLGNRKGFLPGSAHRQLTPEEKTLWDQFSDESKELIMTARSSGAPRVNAPTRRRNGGNAFRSGQGPPAPPTCAKHSGSAGGNCKRHRAH